MMTITAYRIPAWREHFERAESRKLKSLNWVAIPNALDDISYRRIIAQKNGSTLFGIRIGLILLASKMPVRGTLATADGPLDADDIACATGMPATAIATALKVFSDPKIRWLERVQYDGSLIALSESPGEAADSPDASGDSPDALPIHDTVRHDTVEPDRTGPEKTGQKTTDTTPAAIAPVVLKAANSGPDRIAPGCNGAGTKFRNVFVAKVAIGLGLSDERAVANRRAFGKIAARLVSRCDREEQLQLCVEQAEEIRSALGIENVAALWQKWAEQEYPESPSAFSPLRYARAAK